MNITEISPPALQNSAKLCLVDEEHGAEIFRLSRDEEVLRRTFVPDDWSEEAARRWASSCFVAAKEGRGVTFVVVNEHNRIVGVVGIGKIDWNHRTADLHYWIGSPYRGQGYAHAAVAAAARWAILEVGLERVAALIEPENKASIRAAERAGLQLEGCLRSSCAIKGRRADSLVYSLIRQDVSSG